jgi:hypothetical protein
MMRIAFIFVLIVHGLIHLIGATKAFGLAEVAQLKQPIPPATGAVWLAAGLAFMLCAVMYRSGSRFWWIVGAVAIVVSQVLIMRQWSDAKAGTLANLIIALPVVLAGLQSGPNSFRSRFERDRDKLLAQPVPPVRMVTDADLATVPPLYQKYLRRVGAVGKPHVYNMRVVFDAQMRGDAKAAWMPATAEQYEFYTTPARLFHMNASRSGLPLDILHRYVDSSATFQVKAVGLFSMVDSKGSAMTKAETVTLMNDVVVLAPAAALDLPFTWKTVDEHTLDATFSNAGFTVSATMRFSNTGELVGFVSNDRAQVTANGASPDIWSTPISEYGMINGIRVGTHGDANWIDKSGEWTYGKFVISEIAYNVKR